MSPSPETAKFFLSALNAKRHKLRCQGRRYDLYNAYPLTRNEMIVSSTTRSGDDLVVFDGHEDPPTFDRIVRHKDGFNGEHNAGRGVTCWIQVRRSSLVFVILEARVLLDAALLYTMSGSLRYY